MKISRRHPRLFLRRDGCSRCGIARNIGIIRASSGVENRPRRARMRRGPIGTHLSRITGFARVSADAFRISRGSCGISIPLESHQDRVKLTDDGRSAMIVFYAFDGFALRQLQSRNFVDARLRVFGSRISVLISATGFLIKSEGSFRISARFGESLDEGGLVILRAPSRARVTFQVTGSFFSNARCL